MAAGKATIGLDPKLAAALAYAFGMVSGLLILALEKDRHFVRFHAMQSTITFLGVLVAAVVVRSLPLIGDAAYLLFVVAVVVLWMWLILKAVMGEEYKLPYIGELAERRIR